MASPAGTVANPLSYMHRSYVRSYVRSRMQAEPFLKRDETDKNVLEYIA